MLWCLYDKKLFNAMNKSSVMLYEIISNIRRAYFTSSTEVMFLQSSAGETSSSLNEPSLWVVLIIAVLRSRLLSADVVHPFTSCQSVITIVVNSGDDCAHIIKMTLQENSPFTNRLQPTQLIIYKTFADVLNKNNLYESNNCINSGKRKCYHAK